MLVGAFLEAGGVRRVKNLRWYCRIAEKYRIPILSRIN